MTKAIFHGVGRRKSSVARVWLREGTGKFVVNQKDCEAYFANKMAVQEIKTPEKALGRIGSVDVFARVHGGGVSGQAGAVALGVSRAFLEMDELNRLVLRENKLLTVDSRVKERKKPGQKAARRKFQFVKR